MSVQLRLSPRLKKTQDIFVWLVTEIQESKIRRGDKRDEICSFLLARVIQECMAIHNLLCDEHVESAYAFFRVPYDTFVRGLYLLLCAENWQIEHYCNNDKIVKQKSNGETTWVRMNEMQDAIDRVWISPGQFRNIPMNDQESWSLLNSHAHGGLQGMSQFYAYNVDNDAPGPPLADINRIAMMATFLALQAAVHLTHATKDDETWQLECLQKIVEVLGSNDVNT